MIMQGDHIFYIQVMYEDSMNSQSSYQLAANEYQVDKIISKRYVSSNGKKNSRDCQYLVRWKGYPDQKDYTWEPISNLITVKFMVDKFNQRWERQKKSKSKKNSQQNLQNQSSQIAKSSSLNQNNVNILDYNQVQSNKNKNENIDSIKGKSNKLQQALDQKNKSHDRSQITNKLNSISTKQSVKIIQKYVQKQSKHGQFQSFHSTDALKQITRKENSHQNKNVDKYLQQSRKNENNIEKQSKAYPSRQVTNNQKIIDKKEQEKRDVQYGRVVNHSYKNGALLYEVQQIQKEKCIRTVILSTLQAKNSCLTALNTYLQTFLIEVQKFNQKN